MQQGVTLCKGLLTAAKHSRVCKSCESLLLKVNGNGKRGREYGLRKHRCCSLPEEACGEPVFSAWVLYKHIPPLPAPYLQPSPGGLGVCLLSKLGAAA